MLSTQVPPFDNADCRKAVLYAADHEAIQAAWGGPAGGDIATTALPPTTVGYEKADEYGFLKDKNGNPDKAKEALTGLRQAERLLDEDRRPRRPPEGGRRGRGAAAVARARSASRPRSSSTRRATGAPSSPATRSSCTRTGSGS